MITIFAELLLYLIVTLSHDIIDVVTIFIALFVVSKLDEVFYQEMAESELTRRLVSEARFSPLRKIQTTTSRWASSQNDDLDSTSHQVL